MEHSEEVTFKEQIRKQTGEFIVVIIKSGAKCCQQQGILCNVEQDFLVLINQDSRIQIPISAIVAIKWKIKGVKD
ncbi:hypothetical protein Halha_1271 [Halobacteroides halobius DSM 5150]|uniref:Uncharacterized protein n=1 Tax=Halobacteroides halobius (strain ATCC 35273 / DSM 5150 / MD-1) TaxID=748449 RepID=L0K7F3_HALHC|nr:hypothetical protein [Halobacteroides halobius]AGB41217.1 hypothetical protein Halha_1271 [Halobacteroides halobius DSM 5150]